MCVSPIIHLKLVVLGFLRYDYFRLLHLRFLAYTRWTLLALMVNDPLILGENDPTWRRTWLNFEPKNSIQWWIMATVWNFPLVFTNLYIGSFWLSVLKDLLRDLLAAKMGGTLNDALPGTLLQMVPSWLRTSRAWRIVRWRMCTLPGMKHCGVFREYSGLWGDLFITLGWCV